MMQHQILFGEPILADPEAAREVILLGITLEGAQPWQEKLVGHKVDIADIERLIQFPIIQGT
jgi:hypothetical protein